MRGSKRSSHAGRTPLAKFEADALLAELDEARQLFESAERRARTYLAERGVLDQTSRALALLLLDALRGPER